MTASPEQLAVIFDFDDTLVPDSTSRLLESHGIDAKKFWLEDVKSLVEQGYDPTLAYLTLILENVGEDKPFGLLTEESLRAFGRTLDTHYYPGVPTLFRDLRQIVKKHEGISIEFYIISGGLQAVIEGSKRVQANIAGVYGCLLAEDSNNGVLRMVRRCVTFTEKTRYLFEINKGLDPSETLKNPYLVNSYVPEENRPVPFENMIYVGDGFTDIPCFSLVKKMGGMVFGVFHPAGEESAKEALQKLLKPDRVVTMNTPEYGKNGGLGAFLRGAVAGRCFEIEVSRGQA